MKLVEVGCKAFKLKPLFIILPVVSRKHQTYLTFMNDSFESLPFSRISYRNQSFDLHCKSITGFYMIWYGVAWYIYLLSMKRYLQFCCMYYNSSCDLSITGNQNRPVFFLISVFIKISTEVSVQRYEKDSYI